MDNFIGEIRIFAGRYAPQDWAFCNGQLLPISGNEALFSLIGTSFGGNGQTDFALPNLQSRIVVGNGQAPGLSAYPYASKGGSESVTLTEGQMPGHSHAMLATSNPANAPGAAGNLPAETSGGFNFYASSDAQGFNAVTMDPGMLQSAGNGAAHPNIMPSLGLTYIIALTGNYPSRD